MKDGIEFYPFPTVYNDALAMIVAEFGMIGLGAYALICSKLFRNNGYYMDANEDSLILIKREVGLMINDDTVEKIISSCIKRDIFDKEKYEKYKILTSAKVQKDYLVAVRRRKRLEFIGNYIVEKSVEDIVELLKDKGNRIVKIDYLEVKGEKDETTEKVKKIFEAVCANGGENCEKSEVDCQNVIKSEQFDNKLPSDLDIVEKSIVEESKEDNSKVYKSTLEDTHKRERRIKEEGADFSLSGGGENNKKAKQLSKNKCGCESCAISASTQEGYNDYEAVNAVGACCDNCAYNSCNEECCLLYGAESAMQGECVVSDAKNSNDNCNYNGCEEDNCSAYESEEANDEDCCSNKVENANENQSCAVSGTGNAKVSKKCEPIVGCGQLKEGEAKSNENIQNNANLKKAINVVIVQNEGELLYSELGAIEQRNDLRELTTAEIGEFKQAFDKKEVKRAIYLVSKDFRMDKMINEIMLSDFLEQSNNLSLSWLIINSEKVMRGDYRKHTKIKQSTENGENAVVKFLAGIEL